MTNGRRRMTACGAAFALLLGGCADPRPRSVPPVPPAPASVRVAFDGHGIQAIRAAGLADRGTGRRVTAQDPVRLASISKALTAIVVMRLVEAGTLDLDADISGTLGWRVRNPAFPDAPISLRLLLSHRSSLRDGIDYVLPFDASMNRALNDPAAWDAAHPPGSWFHYTNLNFPLIAAVMERATGERFDRLMARLLFAPLKLDACFNWTTCSDRAIARAVVLYDAQGAVLRDDLHGVRPACPILPGHDGNCDLSAWRPGVNGASFSPQGGARVSMRDLAKIGRLLLGDGIVDGVRLLRPESVAALRTPQWSYDGANGDPDYGLYCAYGLGIQLLGAIGDDCGDDLFGDGRPRFGHAGEAYGLRSGLWIDPARGRGVAYFTTAVRDPAPRGTSAWSIVEERIARGR